MLYAAKNHDGSMPTREDARAAAANQLHGICLALDPKGGLTGLVQTVWRLPKSELGPAPPNPGPEAKPAEEPIPPPAGAAPDVDEFVEAVALSAIREALEPFAVFARQTASVDEWTYFAIQVRDDDPSDYAELDMSHLRALLRAAGMFTPEMQAPAPQPGPAVQAEVQPPPPAAPIDAACPEGDPLCAYATQGNHDLCLRPL